MSILTNNQPAYNVIKLYDIIKNSTNKIEKNNTIFKVSFLEQIPSDLCEKIFSEINISDSTFSEETKIFALKQMLNVIQHNKNEFQRKEIIKLFLSNFTLTIKNKIYLDILTPCLDSIFKYEENGNKILKEIIPKLLMEVNKVDINNPFGFIMLINKISLAISITEEDIISIISSIIRCLGDLFIRILEIYKTQQNKVLYFIECLSLIYSTVYNIMNSVYHSKIIEAYDSYVEEIKIFIKYAFYFSSEAGNSIIAWTNDSEYDSKVNEFKIKIVHFIGIVFDIINDKNYQVT